MKRVLVLRPLPLCIDTGSFIFDCASITHGERCQHEVLRLRRTCSKFWKENEEPIHQLPTASDKLSATIMNSRHLNQRSSTVFTSILNFFFGSLFLFDRKTIPDLNPNKQRSIWIVRRWRQCRATEATNSHLFFCDFVGLFRVLCVCLCARALSSVYKNEQKEIVLKS